MSAARDRSAAWRRLSRALGVVFAVAAFAPAARAGAFPAIETTGGTLQLGGSVRTIPVYVDGAPAHAPRLGLDDSRLRLTAKTTSPEDDLVFETHVVEETLLATRDPGPGLPFGIVTVQRYRLAPLAGTSLARPTATSVVFVDRLSFRVRAPRVDLTVGRQPINFSKAYFWNPLDVFAPFDPRAFDRDYKPGVDAVRAQIALGEVSGIDLVATEGPRLVLAPDGTVLADPRTSIGWTRVGSAVLARAYGDVHHLDVAVQAGKIYGGWQAGAGFAGELAGWGIRGEGAYFLAEDRATQLVPERDGTIRTLRLTPDHASVVAGIDRRFDSGLYVAAEYYYNGAGENRDTLAGDVRVLLGETTDSARHLAGALAAFDVTPLVRAQFVVLAAPAEPSALFAPQVTVNAMENLDVLVAAFVGVGPSAVDGPAGIAIPRSEFGSSPLAGFAEIKLYF